MNTKHVLYASLFVTFVQLANIQSALAQYYFERDPASYVLVMDTMNASVTMSNPIHVDQGYFSNDFSDYNSLSSNSGIQPAIASSTTSESASHIEVGFIQASSNTQMTFNPDLVANGQVSALAISTVIGAMDTGPYNCNYVRLRTHFSETSALSWGKFTLKNSQTNAPPTQVKLKIKQSSSFASDPDFAWYPVHSFSIYKNGSSTPLLSSSTAGEVTFIDPAANHGDYYTIIGEVTAFGGAVIQRNSPPPFSMLLFGGSLEVTGEAEVSVVP
ncbi:hypothetical protein FYZ48_18120 [Gimesia chilikensis]|uniref:hypothetical protein n=1 Tax=Gimesia chilikensis TaxID=2605989 RepID=UPI0011ECF510|nr:hypothetical protein [Gimesia chilikensis]KAA0135636.1 hypothetical protein FYZ48_18120 [Gimesia chilikensis]